MTTGATPLDYGHADRRKTRRRIIVTVTIAFLELAVAYIWWNHGERIRSQLAYLYWQRQCANFVMPTGEELAHKLTRDINDIRQDPDLIVSTSGGDGLVLFKEPLITYSPRPFRELTSRLGWSRLRFYGVAEEPQTLFLGARVPPSGKSLILHLTREHSIAGGGEMPGFIDFTSEPTLIPQIGLTDDPKSVIVNSALFYKLPPCTPETPVAVELDNADTSHLVIRYHGHNFPGARMQEWFPPVDVRIDVYVEDDQRLRWEVKTTPRADEAHRVNDETPTEPKP